MAIKPPDKPKRPITLTLIVTYDMQPSEDHLQELMEKAKEEGGVDKAELAYHIPFVRDLRKEY